jgi:hypothetical protein
MQDKEKLIGYDLLVQQYAKNTPEILAGLSDAELIKHYKEADDLYWFYMIMQMVAKELCNSVYGGFGTPSLRYYNYEVAKDITGEGAHACQLMEKTGQSYFRDLWPNDHAWHDQLREKFPQFMKPDTKPQSITQDIVITCDTDSVDRFTQIKIKDVEGEGGVGSVTIEYLFEQLSKVFYVSPSGHEHAKTSMQILNWSSSDGFYFSDAVSIIRHKVTKDKWELKTKNGYVIQTTSDHSLIGFSAERGKHSLKPNEVSNDIKVMTVGIDGDEEYSEIEYCKLIGKFEDEWVYDISMPNPHALEDLQTFVGNNILVHNSNYVTFDLVFESIGIDPHTVNSQQAVDFIVFFMKNRLDPIYASVLDNLINGRNGKNTMEFELEAVGGFGIFVARKKYVYAKLWQDGKYIGDQNKLKTTGIELKQRAAPKEIKKIMTAFVNTIFVKKGKIEADLFFAMCKSVKDELMNFPIPQLCKSTKLNKYQDYVISDYPKVQLRPKAGISIQGSANYNNLIQKHNLQSKYPLLKNGMGIKVFYDTMGQVFAYPIEYGYPEELIPQMNKALQIEKILFAPIRRLTDGMIQGDTKRMGETHIQKGLSSIMNKFKKTSV